MERLNDHQATVAETLSDMTGRQQQIIELMQQGFVNKEIARELNISLGTVKQHLVAIFKKLNVHNRTMAVARLAEFKDQSGFAAAFSRETLLARRPAVVLSLCLTAKNLPRAVHKAFYTLMAEIAFDHDALFIGRAYGEGDLIFGLKRSSAQDIRIAIQAAGRVYLQMQQRLQQLKETADPEPQAVPLTAAMVAGLLTVSQNRFGGWSGETLGSELLIQAHRYRNQAGLGQLVFDPNARSVMQAFDVTCDGGVPDQLALSDLDRLNHWNIIDDLPLTGRETEMAEIQALLDGQYQLLILEGENGMGKSRLCREAARLALRQKKKIHYIRVLPHGFTASLADDENLGLIPALEHHDLLIIDDAHHLTPQQKLELEGILQQKNTALQILISGRQPQDAFAEYGESRRLHLQKLPTEAISKIAGDQQDTDDIADRSRGIPLFARELLLNHTGEISLALLTTVAARIDKFRVDWKLLYGVASHSRPITLQQIAVLMKDDFAYIRAAAERAENLGLLSLNKDVADFSHPLVKDVVYYLFNTPQTSDAISGHS